MQSDTISWFDYPFSSGDLILAAAILLVLAAFLLIFSSRRKVALQHSDVTEELMMYLARISDALEIQSSRTPERVLAEMAAAIKQQNNLAPTPPSLDNEPRPVRVPRFNVEMPPER
jgi:hypothetical protein